MAGLRDCGGNTVKWQGMNRELSIALDLSRILAAGVVFVSHASWQAHTGGLFWQLGGVGREAVDVFFVLSGFVIAHVTAERERTARDFAVNRAARIASVAVPALLATVLLDAVGQAAMPGLYADLCCENSLTVVWRYIRNLLFIGDIWSQHVPPGTNVPWWSLGFEAWYYLAFGLFVFIRKPWNWVAAAAALVVAGPGIAVLFPLWLLGGVGYRVSRRWAPGMWVGAALVAGAGVLVPLVIVFGPREGQIYAAFSLAPGRLLDYGQDYVIGSLFLCILLGVRGLSEVLARVFGAIERPVRWLAGGTFTLYLFHLPLMRALVAVSPWPADNWGVRGLVLFGVPLLVLGIAEVTERKKAFWRNGLRKLVGGA